MVAVKVIVAPATGKPASVFKVPSILSPSLGSGDTPSLWPIKEIVRIVAVGDGVDAGVCVNVEDGDEDGGEEPELDEGLGSAEPDSSCII
jgi:hypothetical protein